MNKEWAEMNKTLQLQIKKKDTFAMGIDTLLELRRTLMELIMQFKNELSDIDFCAMPYINAKGYHSKTIAYSLWHIFRIEDIVVHSLIANVFLALPIQHPLLWEFSLIPYGNRGVPTTIAKIIRNKVLVKWSIQFSKSVKG